MQTADDDALMSRSKLQADEAPGRAYLLRAVAYSCCDAAGAGTGEPQQAQGQVAQSCHQMGRFLAHLCGWSGSQLPAASCQPSAPGRAHRWRITNVSL
ncbi:MAG: hypothetical protein MUF54_16220, partial [Polyangiaceae bacterium]|nr:hypothetical protein [Polyangiaceae bacterium]